jgi:hypothetical protein
MAGELTKWTGGGLVKRSSSALQRSRAAREAAEAALRPQEPVIDPRLEKAARAARAAGERLNNGEWSCFHLGTIEAFDLPRICAVRRLPYVSRYVLRNGQYEYAQDIRHKEGMNAVEYEARYAVTFPLAEEICAWCRAWGQAAVFCRKCEAWSCYGQVAGRQGRCGACGGEWRRIEMGEVKVIGFALKR